MTQNVNAFTLDMPAGHAPLHVTVPPEVMVDAQAIEAPKVRSDRSWLVHFRKNEGGWELVESPESEGLRKHHGLQGPIDDAFMSRFVMVLPSGEPMNETVGNWVRAEQERAIEQWRKIFRGDALTVKDTELTDEQIREANLVLWGDPLSNSVLAKIASRLPVQWGENGVLLGKQKFSADKHVPVFVCPNPLNPKKYVVLNSGFTFRQADHASNARQVPKLPDYAVLDVSEGADEHKPGTIAAAGFFTETWQLPSQEN